MNGDDLEIPGLSDLTLVSTGHSGAVYTATEAEYGRRVAVRVFDPLPDADRNDFDAQRVAMGKAASHPNIVLPFRSGTVPGTDRPYLVMEYLGGGTLQDRLDDGPLDWPEAIRQVRPIADALAHTHRVGVLHRNVRPANILLTDGGTPKLADLGRAAMGGAQAPHPESRRPGYTAPEAYVGGGDAVDERADVWSLGATLYALGTGGPPFVGADADDTVRQILTDPVPSTGRAPLDELFATALAPDPADRFASAEQFLAALDDAARAVEPPAADRTIAAAPLSGPPLPPESQRNGPPSPDTTAPAPAGGRRFPTGSSTTPAPGGPTTSPDDSTTTPAPGGPTTSPDDSTTTPAPGGPTTGPTESTTTPAPGGPTTTPVLGRSGPAPDESTTTPVLEQRAKAAAVGAAEPPAARPPGGRRRRRRGLLVPLGILLAVLAAGAGFWFGRARLSDDERAAEPVASPTTTTGASSTTVAPEVRTEIGEPTIVTNHGLGEVDVVIGLADGRIASGGADGTVRIWDPADPEAPAVAYTGHQGPVGALAQLDDGRIVSARAALPFGSLDLGTETVHLWDPDDPAGSVVTYPGHAEGVLGLAALSDGRVASRDSGTIHLWDPSDPAAPADVFDLIDLVPESLPSAGPLELPDGRLAIGTFGGEVRLWDPSGATTTVAFADHERAVSGLTLLDDGRVVSIDDARAYLWDPAAPAGAVEDRLSQFGASSSVAALADGRVLIGDVSGPVGIWDPAEPDLFAGFFLHADRISSMAVLGDGRVASASDDGSVRIWDPSSDGPTVSFGHGAPVSAVAVLADGRIATASPVETVQVWDPDDPDGPRSRYENLDYVTADALALPAAPVSPLGVLGDGRLVFTSADESVHVWSVDDAAGNEVFSGADAAAQGVAALPSGRIASIRGDGSIRLWDPAEPDRSVAEYTGQSGRVAAVAELADGRIVSGDVFGEIQVWDPAQLAADPVVYDGHGAPVSAILVLDDGRVASGDATGAVHLWDPAEPGSAEVVDGRHAGLVTDLVQLADGRLASGGIDGTVALWSPDEPDEVQATYDGHTWVSALAELPDGRIASAGGNGLHLWLPPTP